jgi:hypothetical protein
MSNNSDLEALRVERNFQALCTCLRHNDPSVTSIDGADSEYPLGYARRLGQAVQGNAHVTGCHLDVSALLSGTEVGDQVDGLLDYLSNSETLLEVTLYDCAVARKDANDFAAQLYGLILRSLSNHQHLTTLVLSTLEFVPLDAFKETGTSCPSLKTLDIFASSFYSFPPKLVSQAIGAMKTLECITLRNGVVGDEEEDDAVGACILGTLGTLPNLRELVLFYESGGSVTKTLQDALITFLNTTRSLNHLHLGVIRFRKKDASSMERFVNALHSLHSLEKLTLDDCVLDKDASRVFIRAMQSGRSNGLRELNFELNRSDFHGHSFERDVGDMLVGSSIQTLSIDMMHNIESFCAALKDNCAKVWLRNLRLSGSFPLNPLLKLIPFLVYLEDLHFTPFPYTSSSMSLFLDSVRQSGSLRSVSFGTTQTLEGMDLLRFRAYCKRNEVLPKLLTKSEMIDATQGIAAHLVLMPTLFAVAKQAPRTSPNSIFAGVLSSMNCLEPKKGSKRLL